MTTRKVGAPKRYTAEIGNLICARLANGESLLRICKDDDMPDRETVRSWIVKGTSEDGDEELKEFFGNYARAREAQADAIFEECLEIADTCEDTQKARLQVETRKWMAGKMRPRKYGDKLELSGKVDSEIKIDYTEILLANGITPRNHKKEPDYGNDD
jgi:hypothetical protein